MREYLLSGYYWGPHLRLKFCQSQVPGKSHISYLDVNKFTLALDSVARLVGVSFRVLNVVGFVPGQGTYLGCTFSPCLGCVQEATSGRFSLSSMFLSLLSLSPFFPPSL